MVLSLKRIVLPLLTGVLLTNTVQAAKMASYCSSEEGSSKIEGINIEKRFPIASVSKLFTTYWALSLRSENYQFKTSIHVTPAENGKFDIHLQGSRDPFFGKESFHYLISALNKMNITKIRKLTFDEDFKFIWNVNAPKTMWVIDYTPDSPSPAMVADQLKNRSLHRSLLDGYSQTRALAQERKHVALVPAPKFSVEKIEFLQKSQFVSTQKTAVYQFKSAQLMQLLKQMNKTSNNHAANQIFESLGGAVAFNKFIQKDLSTQDSPITEQNIRFLNGSGDNFRIVSGQDEYNEASCGAIINMLKHLKARVERKNLTTLQDIIAVVGGDTSYKDSTNTLGYLENKDTKNAVLAKTGTVNSAITLGGMLSTKDGNVFFYFSESIQGRDARRISNDQRIARAKIKLELAKLTKKYKGTTTFDYREAKFLSFDGTSDIISNASTPSDHNFKLRLSDNLDLENPENNTDNPSNLTSTEDNEQSIRETTNTYPEEELSEAGDF